MVYDTLAGLAKDAAHCLIDYTFPQTPFIATITGGVSWYSYRAGMTYSQGIITNLFVEKMGYAGYATSPLFTPTLAPYISLYFSIGAACGISLTLNLLRQGILKAHACWKKAFSKERPAPIPLNVPLHVEPGYRLEQVNPPPAAPKRNIQVPVQDPRSIHNIYLG